MMLATAAAMICGRGTPEGAPVHTDLPIGHVVLEGAVALQTVQVDWSIALPVTAAAVTGGLVGGWLAGRVRADRLRTAFGWFVFAMGGLVLVQQAPPALFHTGWGLAALPVVAVAAIAYLIACRRSRDLRLNPT